MLSSHDDEQEARKVVRRSAYQLGDAREIVGRGGRYVFGVRVPVADVIEPQFVMPEYLFLLGGSMGSEGESSPAVAGPWSGRGDDLPVVTANPREKLPPGFAVVETTLAVSVERRQCLRAEADGDPLHLEFHDLFAHGNAQSPS